MIIVTGSVRARDDTIDAVVSLSLEHVHRSRREPGCLLHSVLRDVEDPMRLVFFEQWADRDAIAEHFAQPASIAFVTALNELASEPPSLHVYEAGPAQL
jgi:quinol monooxygenase YgiN